MTVIAILWPTFALVTLVVVVWFTMVVQRLGHIKRNPPSARDFADGESALRYFRPVEMPTHNFANLFEMPVLFFALIPLLMITHQANHIQVILAWAYVVLRAIHSFIHIGPKKVRPRFMVYLLSCAVLMAMWIGFFVDMLTAANTLSTIG
ncbi:MAG: MAPEG family protein [Pseudomonadota bacterium]|uniref:MAPEG family protein n=1 Tax=Sphingomonas sp. ERG5 TaxID=1381597 RepID=UPI00068CCB5E|nr:MAPEG family protein [Sphingomonas sp. ERG5]